MGLLPLRRRCLSLNGIVTWIIQFQNCFPHCGTLWATKEARLQGSGIVAFGAYVPQLRLSRQAVFQANAWFNDNIRSLAKGERSMCNWDEDALTMAIEAARDCLEGIDRGFVRDVVLASTTLPFADRQNAGILATALNLPEEISTSESGGSQRAATTNLLRARKSGAADPTALTLVVASE
jgi:hydroxymethylglutaryl-CoA synthase